MVCACVRAFSMVLRWGGGSPRYNSIGCEWVLKELCNKIGELDLTIKDIAIDMMKGCEGKRRSQRLLNNLYDLTT